MIKLLNFPRPYRPATQSFAYFLSPSGNTRFLQHCSVFVFNPIKRFLTQTSYFLILYKSPKLVIREGIAPMMLPLLNMQSNIFSKRQN